MTKMSMNDFTEWAQRQMDQCNVHNEIETSKLMVEIMKKFFAVGREGKEVSETG